MSMPKQYRYFLLLKRWIARLENGKNVLEPKEFFENGEWQYNYELNLRLNDSIMGYADCSVFDYEEISEEKALALLNT
jgi:hypothetical protein